MTTTYPNRTDPSLLLAREVAAYAYGCVGHCELDGLLTKLVTRRIEHQSTLEAALAITAGAFERGGDERWRAAAGLLHAAIATGQFRPAPFWASRS